MAVDFNSLEQAHIENKFNFVYVELDLAIIFAEIATSAASKERKERNLQHALQAYRSAKKFIDEQDFTAERMAILAPKLDRISLLIGQL